MNTSYSRLCSSGNAEGLQAHLDWEGELGGLSCAGCVDGSQERRPGVGHFLKERKAERALAKESCENKY